ncbi:Dipeptidyl Peptidase 8 [Manis pentadactyla]|nr:Dipeptidyl Peptidase 8 [Manis pentadactyla]
MVDLFRQYPDLRNCTYDGGLSSNPCGAAEPALAPGLNAAPCPMELKSLSLCQPSPDWAMILTSNFQSMERVRYKCRQKDVAVFSKLQNTIAEGLWFGFVGKSYCVLIQEFDLGTPEGSHESHGLPNTGYVAVTIHKNLPCFRRWDFVFSYWQEHSRTVAAEMYFVESPNERKKKRKEEPFTSYDLLSKWLWWSSGSNQGSFHKEEKILNSMYGSVLKSEADPEKVPNVGGVMETESFEKDTEVKGLSEITFSSCSGVQNSLMRRGSS